MCKVQRERNDVDTMYVEKNRREEGKFFVSRVIFESNLKYMFSMNIEYIDLIFLKLYTGYSGHEFDLSTPHKISRSNCGEIFKSKW